MNKYINTSPYRTCANSYHTALKNSLGVPLHLHLYHVACKFLAGKNLIECLIPTVPWQTSALELSLVCYIHILAYRCTLHLWNGLVLPPPARPLPQWYTIPCHLLSCRRASNTAGNAIHLYHCSSSQGSNFAHLWHSAPQGGI